MSPTIPTLRMRIVGLVLSGTGGEYIARGELPSRHAMKRMPRTRLAMPKRMKCIDWFQKECLFFLILLEIHSWYNRPEQNRSCLHTLIKISGVGKKGYKVASMGIEVGLKLQSNSCSRNFARIPAACLVVQTEIRLLNRRRALRSGLCRMVTMLERRRTAIYASKGCWIN